MNQGYEYRERVEPGSAGGTLLDHLARKYRHSTRAEWRARIEAGAVAIDGEPAASDAVLHGGQEVVWTRPPWEEPEAPLSWALLHRDADLLAVAKPAGLPTLPGGGFLEHTLLARVRRLHPETAPVHRLDRGTSGVVLFARTPAAGAALADAFRARRVAKTYRALVRGHPARDAFEVNAPVARLRLSDDSAPFVAAATIAAPAAGRHRDAPRPARTEVQVLERRADGTSLLEVRPVTGRPHQIRIHLAAAGHPLVGEPFYVAGGSARPGAHWPGATGFLLHAWRICLEHPRLGHQLAIECAPPPALRIRSRTGQA